MSDTASAIRDLPGHRALPLPSSHYSFSILVWVGDCVSLAGWLYVQRIYSCGQSTISVLVIIITRNRRQSYQHADSRRQQQHTAVAARITSNRLTVTVFVTVLPWPLNFWFLGHCMPSDCYSAVYKVWCRWLKLFFF